MKENGYTDIRQIPDAYSDIRGSYQDAYEGSWSDKPDRFDREKAGDFRDEDPEYWEDAPFLRPTDDDLEREARDKESDAFYAEYAEAFKQLEEWENEKARGEPEYEHAVFSTWRNEGEAPTEEIGTSHWNWLVNLHYWEPKYQVDDEWEDHLPDSS